MVKLEQMVALDKASLLLCRALAVVVVVIREIDGHSRFMLL